MPNLAAPLTKPRFVVAGIALPVLATVIALAIQLSALGELPNPVAINFGGSGKPGAFAAPELSIAMTAIIGLGIPLSMSLGALRGIRAGGQGGVYRMTGTAAAGLSALVASLTTMLLVGQRGLDDAVDARFGTNTLVVALAVTAAVTAVAWFIQPADTPHVAAPITPMELEAGTHTVWLSEASMSPRGIAMLGLAVVALWVGAGIAWVLSSDPFTALIMSIVGLVITILATATGMFRVVVSEAGLTVRSVAGFPSVRVPLDQIETVEVVEVNALGEFGGFGFRRLPRRLGVITRNGDAIAVTRTDGPDVVVTARDCATGAALLAALAPNVTNLTTAKAASARKAAARKPSTRTSSARQGAAKSGAKKRKR